MAKMPNLLLGADAAVVGPVHDTVPTIEQDVQSSATGKRNLGAQILKQRLYIPPVNVPLDRVAEHFRQYACMFMAHGT